MHGQRNWRKRENRRNKKKAEQPELKPEPLRYGCIIKKDNFCYHYLGTIGERERAFGTKYGETIADERYCFEFTKENENYLLVKAVFLYQGKYYYIPATFSLLGTIQPSDKVTCVCPDFFPPGKFPTLAEDICLQVCPGYLD